MVGAVDRRPARLDAAREVFVRHFVEFIFEIVVRLHEQFAVRTAAVQKQLRRIHAVFEILHAVCVAVAQRKRRRTVQFGFRHRRCRFGRSAATDHSRRRLVLPRARQTMKKSRSFKKGKLLKNFRSNA